MTAKPETAAEVLADINNLIAQNPLHDVSIGGFKTYHGHLIDFRDRLERALSAQGEAVAWQINATKSRRGWETCTKECYDDTLRTGRYMGFPEGSKDVEVRALYTHPAPAQVTEEAVERGWKAFVMSFGDLATPEEYLNYCTVNEMAELKKAIRAALEADHGP